MSAAVSEQVPTLDLSGTDRVPMSRLVAVELRKLADTRAGKWLLIAIGIITALVVTVFFLSADAERRTFGNFMGATAGPQGFLLPVLGILLVTSEWSQRTALVTFTLVPVRSRVFAAKVLAAVIAGLAAIVAAVVVAALATAAGGADNAWAGTGPGDFGKFALLQVGAILQGLAFGLLLLNSAAAIVLYFVVPSAFSILTSLVSGLKGVQPWIDLGTAQKPLLGTGGMDGSQWAHLATSLLLWVVLPFVVGMLRVLRAEVK